MLEAKMLIMWGAFVLLAIWVFGRISQPEKAAIKIPIDDR